MKSRNFFIIFLLILTICIPVFSETIILKNGRLIIGEIMEYRRSRGLFVVNVLGKTKMVEEIIDVYLKDIEAILITQVVTGINGDFYNNYKYQVSIKKPSDKWFFVENPLDTKPLITIAKTSDFSPEDQKFRLFVYGPFENLPEGVMNNNNKFIDFAKEFFIENFKLYIGYEEGIETINDIKFYWRNSNNFVFTRIGQEIKMQYKQYLTVKGKYVIVMDYCDDEKKFNRETQELSQVINTFSYVQDENIFFQISSVFYSQKNYKQALFYIKKALELQPERGELYQKQGDIYGKMGMPKEAMRSFEEAIRYQADPVFVNFLLNNTSNNHYNGLWRGLND